MAYSELIKNFNKIRDYMRDFYVYGFKTRDEYNVKSARSYDNERRRIESWLGEYMSFNRNASGKNVFLSVDSRTISENPFYKAFKAKSFTSKDIMLHFYIEDILADGRSMTAFEITEAISEKICDFDESCLPDESTVRKKLAEYMDLGLLREERCGRSKKYSLQHDEVDLCAWKDALDFYSEQGVLGVVGSYIKDRCENSSSEFMRFKHHYILQALDSEIIYKSLMAIEEKRTLDIEVHSKKKRHVKNHHVLPIKIYVSAQTGRYYLCVWNLKHGEMMIIRTDNIQKITTGVVVENADIFISEYDDFAKYLWGVSFGNSKSTDTFEMIIRICHMEYFIVERLNREKRNGIVEILDENTVRFTAEVYDASEMIPWVRTFIGRIESLKCSNKGIEKGFKEDMKAMAEIYGIDVKTGGGDIDVVS